MSTLVKSSAILLFCFGAVVGSTVLLWPRAKEPQPVIGANHDSPQLSVEPLELDCPESGNLEIEGIPTTTAEFKIANRGTETLHVEVDKNCGCLAISEQSMDLLPGEVRRLTVDIRAPRVGRRTVAVTLWTNDPNKHSERLLITTHGSTKPPLLISSSSQLIAFRDVLGPGGTREINIVTLEASDTSNWIETAVASTEHLVLSDARVHEEPQGSRGNDSVTQRKYTWTISLVSLPDEPHFLGRVAVFGGDRNAPIESFDVQIERIQRYRVSPSSLLILESSDSAPLTRRILVAAQIKNEQFKVTETKSDQPWLEANALPRNGNDDFIRTVEVRVVNRPLDSFAKATVEICIDGSEPTTLFVPVVYKRNSTEE